MNRPSTSSIAVCPFVHVRLLVAIVALCLAPSMASAGWTTDASAAAAESRRTGKPILANFTGSDWCQYCIKLEKEVFKTAQFKKWAADNVVLLYIDFPNRSRQSSSLKRQNKQLASKYKVTGFPTVLFLDGKGTAHGKTGYFPGGADGWIKNAESFTKRIPALERVTPLSSLVEGQKQAADDGKMLLLINSYGTLKKDEAAIQSLLASEPFVKLAKEKLVVVHHQSKVKSKSEGVKAAETKAVGALLAKHKQRSRILQYFLFDSSTDQMILKIETRASTRVLEKRLTDAIAKLEKASAKAAKKE